MKSLLVVVTLISLCACKKTLDTVVTTDDAANAVSGTGGKRIVLVQGPDKGKYINGNSFSYKPGDTLVLKGQWYYCSLENVYGKPGLPVVIINAGGQVTLSQGFNLGNCRYIKVTGSGTTKKYGFKVTTKDAYGVGVNIYGRSSNIEIERVDIYNKVYGYWVKQEGSCVDSLQYPNFVMDNITIHDGRIRKMGQEGMYLGSTDPNGTRPVTCNGRTIYPKPFRLGNIKVYNMIIDSTNRSGIQLSSASEGMSEIYNNKVSNCGFEFNTNGQGSGISIGGYTRGSVHNNTVTNTYTMGISSLGSGPMTISNNTVTNAGILSGRVANGMSAIMIDTRPTSPVDSTRFVVLNNTLGKNTDVAVRVYKTYNTYFSTGNRIAGNSGTTSVASGIKWSNK